MKFSGHVTEARRSATLIGISGITVALGLVIFALIILHSVVHVCWKTQQCGPTTGPINVYGYLFDLAAEGNIPTWYAVVQLFTVALMLGFVAIARRVQKAPTAAWWGLAVIFAYLTLDEATDMHGLWRRWLGDYTIPGMQAAGFSWIIPGIIVVSVIAAIYLPWVLKLPSRTRVLFVIAGAVYVTGGIALEGVGGFLADFTFSNDSYLVAVTLEESCELYGILIMLYAVLHYLGKQSITLSAGDAARGATSEISERRGRQSGGAVQHADAVAPHRPTGN